VCYLFPYCCGMLLVGVLFKWHVLLLSHGTFMFFKLCSSTLHWKNFVYIAFHVCWKDHVYTIFFQVRRANRAITIDYIGFFHNSFLLVTNIYLFLQVSLCWLSWIHDNVQWWLVVFSLWFKFCSNCVLCPHQITLCC
jgi:hypothetical protein